MAAIKRARLRVHVCDQHRVGRDEISSGIFRVNLNEPNKSELWSAEIQQFFVNEEGDIEFIPRVGNHTVVLGNDQFLDEKFNKLIHFYKEGLNKKGWDNYKVINLKYKNQVVCIKK